jgi:hypothetical protein
LLAFTFASVALFGCKLKEEKQENNSLTLAEAQQALEEAAVSGDAENVMAGSIEITTSFTIGQAVEHAAQEIRDFVHSQLPCAEVTLADATLTIEYGALPGSCTYKGRTYSGTHSITVDKNADDDVLVHHEWASLSNGRVSVTGTADVTWTFDDPSRRVVHELTWTRLADGRTGTGSGDRLQTPLAGGLDEGLEVNGSRSWVGDAGTWDLAIDGVQFRWVDPVPQAGQYTLLTPKGKTLSLGFSRVDEDTIHVTLKSGDKELGFDVTKAGDIEG